MAIKRIKFYGRRRPGAFFKNIEIFFRKKVRSLKRWFLRTFPKKRPGQPFYTSKRFFLLAGACGCAVAIVFSCIAISDYTYEQEQIAIQAAAQQEEEQRKLAEAEAIRREEEFKASVDFASGYEGPEVEEIQVRLADLGYIESDEPTQKFGPATEQAVMRFQLLSGLEADGRILYEDWEALFSDDAPTSTITEGMQGDDIAEYQTRLINLGYLNSSATGYFGTDTASAVDEFQEKNSLAKTGNIDAETAEKLYSEDVVAKYLMFGMKNDAVKEVQQRLIDLGYLGGEADGDFGSRTTDAVRLFQKKSGLVVDGYLGVDTKTKLMSPDAQPNAFSVGDEGDSVMTLQEKLVSLNYINKATGYYGSDTKEAVINFQNNNGLTADGMAGKMTLTKLYADDVKKGSSPVIVGRNSGIQNFIDMARSRLGCPYVLGAKGSSRFDCSGLVYWALNKVGINQSYVTSTVWRTVGNYKTIKDIDDVRAGDIICFTPHHVGIATSSSMMIDASTNHGQVVERTFRSPYFERNFVCARRIF